MNDEQQVEVREQVVLSKFEGEPLPENEFERIHIENGEIIAVHKIENGEIVSTKTVKEVE